MVKGFKYLLLIICIIFVPLYHSFADGLKFRKYAGEFMEIGVDARAQAMGGAFTSISGEVSSSYYNPAGILTIEKTQLSFMHTQQMIASVNYDFLAYGRKLKENRVIAVTVVRLGVDNIRDSRQAKRIIDEENWNIDWSKIKNFNYADYIFTLSMAQYIRKNWKIGANLKLIRRDLSDYSANGIGFDFGIQRSLFERGTVGLNIRNVTTTIIAWNTGEKELVKPVIFFGGSYQIDLNKLNSSILPVLDFIIRLENRKRETDLNLGLTSVDITAGLEYSYRKILFVRTGVDEIKRLNLGIGIQIPHIRIDYAFTHYDNELGNSHRIGLLLSL